MSDDEQREILEAVAAGRLSPTEAAERLSRLTDDEGPGPTGLRQVRVEAMGHAVRVIGDPSVREAVADGPHTATRDGDTLLFVAERAGRAGAIAGSFAFAHSSASAHTGPHVRVHERRWRGPSPLVVRMNPALALAADVGAGSIDVRGVSGPLTLSLSAGSANIRDFRGPIDLDVTAGSVSARGMLDGGESRIRCTTGSIRLTLVKGSSVRIQGTTHAGALVLPGGSGKSGVLGGGAGSLDVEVTTGSVVIR